MYRAFHQIGKMHFNKIICVHLRMWYKRVHGNLTQTWWIGGYMAFKHTGHSNSSRTLLETVKLGFREIAAGSFTCSPTSNMSSLWGGSMTSGLLRISSKNGFPDAIQVLRWLTLEAKSRKTNTYITSIHDS